MALLDRCVFLPVAAGLADFVVSAAVAGFMTPAQAGGVNGQTYSYVAESSDGQFWEMGRGVYTSGVLTRATILFSSASGAKVNFNSAPTVAIDALAEDIYTTIGYTVSTLPSGVIGMRAHVTDAASPTFLGTLTGSGTVKCPVFYNGSAWVAG